MVVVEYNVGFEEGFVGCIGFVCGSFRVVFRGWVWVFVEAVCRYRESRAERWIQDRVDETASE